MGKNKALLLHSMDGDWEGLFINGELIDQGHHLGEGQPEVFWLDIGSKYGISSAELVIKEVEEVDGDKLEDIGSFPQSLDQMCGNYE